MKSIICPVSSERVSGFIPRITAFYVVALLLLAAATQFYALVALLAVDFYLRGFQKGKYSVLAILSQKTNKLLNLNGRLIDKAPKVFAARLGFVFTLAISILGFAGFDATAIVFSGALIAFALLECVFDLCVGCVIYSWLVLPSLK